MREKLPKQSIVERTFHGNVAEKNGYRSEESVEIKGVLSEDRYELMIDNWLERDKGKHEFGLEHKKALMEALALEIHRRTERVIRTNELE